MTTTSNGNGSTDEGDEPEAELESSALAPTEDYYLFYLGKSFISAQELNDPRLLAGAVDAYERALAMNRADTTLDRAEAAPPDSRPLSVFDPVKTFEGGKARFYDYKTDAGVNVKYFILKSSDGVIRAAFDACDVCWAEGKGYSQKGDFMVCNNCKMRFASIRINEAKGGCNHHPLNRQVVDGNVVIKIADIVEGAR